MTRLKHFAMLMMGLVTVGTMAAQGIIEITFDGKSAAVTIPSDVVGVTATANGANVTIVSSTTTTEYTYRVSGQSSDGSLTINGDYKLTLQLAGLVLTNAHGGAAIDVECGKRVAVELVDGTVNTLEDSALGAQKAALYFKGHPEFEGAGTLNVTGRMKHAICSKEYMELKSSTGTINILGAVSDGLHCGKGKVANEHNYFLMKGGTVNVMGVGGDGIDSDDYGVIRIEDGTLSLNVGSDATGLKADSTVSISGGQVDISVKGTDSEAIRARYSVDVSGGKLSLLVDGDGSKGIKGKRVTEATGTVKNGGAVSISGGDIEIEAIGGNFIDTATGDTAKCMALSVDADLSVTGGTIALASFGPDAKPYNVKGVETIADETLLDITRVPWLFNRRNYQHHMTAYVRARPNRQWLTDYSNVAVGAFIGDDCVGYGVFDTTSYGTVRIHNNTTDASTVTFRVYYSDWRQTFYPTTSPIATVSFQPDSFVGTPGSPLALSYTAEPKKGDVNLDGNVDWEDVQSVISVMAGSSQLDADVNGDGSVNIADILSIILCF